MKKIFTLFLPLMMIVSCTSITTSEKGRKSEAYVRQQLHEQGVYEEDIESVKYIRSDSLLGMTPLAISSYELVMSDNILKYYKGEIKIAKLDSIYKDWNDRALKAQISWETMTKPLDLCDMSLREVGIVKIRFKSGKEETRAILFANDGNPWVSDKELLIQLNKKSRDIQKMYFQAKYDYD